MGVVFSFILPLFKILLKLFCLFFLPFFISIFCYYIYFRFFRGYKRKEGHYQLMSHGSKVKRLLFDFPKRYVLDYFETDPSSFREFGLQIVVGEQGTGKTITVAYLLKKFKEMYPKMVVKTNFEYKNQNFSIESYKDVVDSTNGIYGEIDVIDEIQNWFNSLQSKDFPPEMLGEISQQRKQRKMILGTTQVFGRLAKPIREQTYLIYKPFTFFGCVTFVLKFKPLLSATDGSLKSKSFSGCFFFVHTKEIRDSFDTYKKIERMANEGFKNEQCQIRSEGGGNVVIRKNKKFKKEIQ